MKTTIEIPDAIAQRVKVLAAERRTTLRELVLQGLESVLNEGQMNAKERSQKLFAAMDQLHGVSASKRLSRADANAR
ncbi:MAG: hypothetical protein V4584_10965 [Verrucomicrobiota bacterium]